MNLNKLININPKDLFKKDNVLVFHHIPKCGGSSIVKMLSDYYCLKKDYNSKMIGKPEFNLSKIDIEKLKNCHCLVGHFEKEGNYLKQRYPEIIKNKNFKIITFLRDPLDVKVSLYYYENRLSQNPKQSLGDHLFGRTNYIADRFPCKLENYKQILDRYFFIGLLEFAKESIELLSLLLNKNFTNLPLLNKSNRDDRFKQLNQEIILKFKQENKLDYLIYGYALKKFRLLRDKYNIAIYE